MLKLLKSEFGFTDKTIRLLSLRDETQVFLHLKKTHHSEINKNAAIRIQATAKMYMIRKRYLALSHLRHTAAATLTAHYRR